MVPQGKVWLHLRNIATQWHIKYIIIPEEKNGSKVRKEDQSLLGKTANPIALCLMSKDLDGSVLSTLLTSTHSSILSWFHSLHSVLLGRYSMILASSTSWDGPDTLVFTIIVLHSGLSGSLALHRLHVRILLSQAELSVTLKLGKKIPWPTYTCILQDWKAGTEWTILPCLAISLGKTLVPLNHISSIYFLQLSRKQIMQKILHNLLYKVKA